MGVIENIRENIKDIGQGIRDVVSGRESTTQSRKKAISEREFEKIRASPAPADTSGYTPVKDPSGRVISSAPTRGGGSGGRGGGRVTTTTGRGADLSAQQQKDTAQKAAVTAASAKLADILAKRTASDISAQRQDIQRRGGRVTTKTSRDVRTGGQLEITETKKGGELVRDVKDVETGEIKSTFYAPGVAGGGVALRKGVITKEDVQVVEKPILVKEEFKGDNIIFRDERITDRPNILGLKDIPGLRTVEDVQREIIKDTKKPETIQEVFLGAAQIPILAAEKIGEKASQLIGRIAPEEGIPITISAKPAKEISFIEPQFGTITTEAPGGVIERKVVIPAQPERQVRIFERKRVEEGVKAGFVLGAAIAQPELFVAGFVAEGTQAALDVERTPIERALGVAEAGLALTFVGAKATRFLRTPIVKTKPLPLAEPQAVEVVKVIPIRGKPTRVSLFEIRGEVRPTTIIERTTKGRELVDRVRERLGESFKIAGKPVVKRLEPKLEIIPAKQFSVITPKLVIGEQPFIVSEVQAGRRFAVLSKIKGKTAPTSLKEFEKLPKLEQFLWKQRAEQITGGPVSKKLISKVLSEEKKRVVSVIESEKLLKITPKPRTAEIEFIPKGRRIERALAVTELEKAATIKAGELTKATTLFKKVTRPGARAIGKTPKLETTILELKPKIPEDAVKFVKPAEIKKTPLTKTFQEQVAQPLTARVPLPKPEIVKPSIKVITQPVTPTEKVLPVIVGGLETESVFAGTGQLEVTAPQVTGFNGLSLRTQPQERIDIKPEVKVEVAQPQIELLRPAAKQIELLKPATKQRQPQAQPQKQPQAEKQISKVAQALELRSVQQLRQPQELITTAITTPAPRPPAPKPLIIPPKKPTPAKTALKKLKEKVKDEFEVFARVKGKDVSIGKAETPQAAAKLLAKRLKKTIAASGFIEKDGQKLSAIETGLVNGEFTTSRLEGHRLVQKKAKRLGTTQETTELQFFKKAKGGGPLLRPSKRKGGKKNAFSFF